MVEHLRWTAIILSVTISSAVSSADSLLEDRFDGTLQSQWRWLDKDDSAWNLSGNRLNIKRYIGHGFFGSDNNRVPVLYVPDVALEDGMYVQVKVGFDVDREYGQAGLILFYDNDTYSKFVIEYWYQSGLHVIFLQEINTVKQNGTVISGSDNQAYDAITIEMKIAIENGTFGSWYRHVGDAAWKEQCISAALPSRGAVKIGLFSQADMGSSDWAWFDDFKLYRPGGGATGAGGPGINRVASVRPIGRKQVLSLDPLGRQGVSSVRTKRNGLLAVRGTQDDCWKLVIPGWHPSSE